MAWHFRWASPEVIRCTSVPLSPASGRASSKTLNSGAERWLWRDGGGGLSEAMVRFAARFEMARDVEDVLARRSRLLFLDAAQAAAVADDVAALLRDELGERFDARASAASFKALAAHYLEVP